MEHNYNLPGGIIGQRTSGKSFRSAIVSLFFYSILCLVQVWPVQEVTAQNFLDNVGLPTTQAIAAYSVRKLSSTYNGPAMMVKRSDSVSASVAFDASNVISASSLVTLQITATVFSSATIA
ncbi:MAG: hypothetical protein ABIS01_03550, partial [Ferruginibacter sp.]